MKKVGKLFGVPICVDISGMLLLTLILTSLGFVPFLIVVGSLLMHEFAHVLTGKKYGIATDVVVINGLGAAAMMRLSNNPKEEFWIGIAGPLSNIVLAFIFIPFLESTIINYAFMINLALGLFNIFPAFPMDGGRILRAVLYHFLWDKDLATKISAQVGLGFAVGFFIVGVVTSTIMLMLIFGWVGSICYSILSAKSTII